MKLVRTVIVFDRCDHAKTRDWAAIHLACKEAVGQMVHPPGAKTFTIRKKSRKLDANGHPTNQWNRNGVTPIKTQFFERLTSQGWRSESGVGLRAYFKELRKTPEKLNVILRTYPGLSLYQDAITNEAGHFDFVTKSPENRRVAVEWETGNVSSSHRSLNKLCLCMIAGLIDYGILLLPSREFYKNLTDRVGNFEELSPYLLYWGEVGRHVRSGLLAVIVVEHDQVTENEEVPYFKPEKQGRSEEGAAKLL